MMHGGPDPDWEAAERKNRRSFFLMGVDMSLTAAGLVGVPATFATPPDFSDLASVRKAAIRTETWGLSLKHKATIFEQLARLRELRDRTLRFWYEIGSPRYVFFEEYAFAATLSYSHAIGEAGGITKLALADAGAVVATVTNNTARKLLCGYCPRKSKEAKALVQHTLKGFGFHGLEEAEYDALCVANYGLSELGQPCLAMPPVDTKKRKSR